MKRFKPRTAKRKAADKRLDKALRALKADRYEFSRARALYSAAQNRDQSMDVGAAHRLAIADLRSRRIAADIFAPFPLGRTGEGLTDRLSEQQ